MTTKEDPKKEIPPLPLPQPEGQIKSIFSLKQLEIRHKSSPSPEELKALAEVNPNYPDRILTNFEKNSEHKRNLENKEIELKNKRENTTRLGILAPVLIILFITLLIALVNTWQSAIFGAVFLSLSGLIPRIFSYLRNLKETKHSPKVSSHHENEEE